MLIVFVIMILVGISLVVGGLEAVSVKTQSYNQCDYESYTNQNEEQFRLFNEEVQRQQSQQFVEEMQRQQDHQFIEESLKSVTPFELGGHDMMQGNSFNNGMF